MFFFGKKKAEPDRTKEEAAPKADKDGLLENASELIRKLDTVQDKKEKRFAPCLRQRRLPYRLPSERDLMRKYRLETYRETLCQS